MKNKKIVIILVLGISIVVFGLYGYFKAVPGMSENSNKQYPEITVAPDTFDFGDINYGDIAQHSFIVKNIGQQTLKIEKVATSCSCTSAAIDQMEIAPGAEAKLDVTYNSGLMTGSHAKGKQERIIYIKSNDPVNPQIEITIDAYVK